MCAVSQIIDHYRSLSHWPPWWQHPEAHLPPQPQLSEDVALLRTTLQEFKEGLAAARVVDRILGQEGCEGAKEPPMESLIARLEMLLDGQFGPAA